MVLLILEYWSLKASCETRNVILYSIPTVVLLSAPSFLHTTVPEKVVQAMYLFSRTKIKSWSRSSFCTGKA